MILSSKRKARTMQRKGANRDYMRAMQELRRSNASGIHKSKRNYDRNSAKRDWKREVFV